MPEAIIMPKMGMDITEVTLLRWTKTVGDKIKRGDVIAEGEGDKVSFEVESPVDGVILRLMGNPDDLLVVGTVIGYVGVEGEEVEFSKSPLMILVEQLEKSNEILRSERSVIRKERDQALYRLSKITAPKIFISYSRDDNKVKDDIVNRLRRIYGSDNVWADDMLIGGQKWWDDILKKIASSNLIIYLLSSESNSSKYCQAELQEAKRLRKKILPIKVRRTVQTQHEINQVQMVDMSEGISIDSFADLIASINYLSWQNVPLTSPLSNQRTPLPSDN